MQGKKTNILDLFIVITIIFSIYGYVCAKSENTSLNKIILDKENIAIEIFLPDLPFSDNDYFKVGEQTSITIRNRPYTKLKIIKSTFKSKLAVVPNLSGTYKTIEDPTKATLKDHYVTLSDAALKTKDGYVIGGNKIKIGNPVELEGFNYRFSGKVINVFSLND